jgi:hypothetical protein
LSLPPGWTDQTLHILAGPIEDDVQHTITVSIERDVEEDLEAYASRQIDAMAVQLKSVSVLKREVVALASGSRAVRAVLDWHPTDERRVVQEFVCTLKGTTAFRLTATFSAGSFESLGPEVEAILHSFEPA